MRASRRARSSRRRRSIAAPRPLPRLPRLRDRVPVGRAVRRADRGRAAVRRGARRATARWRAPPAGGALTTGGSVDARSSRRCALVGRRRARSRGSPCPGATAASRTRRPWPRGVASPAAVLEPEGPARGTALLLTGCVADTLFAAPTLATARLLARAGVRVLVPPAPGCCGALALHLGAGRARAAARRRDVAHARRRARADWVVTQRGRLRRPCSASTITLPATSAPRAVARTARDALDAARRARPAAAGRAGCSRRPSPCTIPVISRTARACARRSARLLAAIPGVELVELEESDWCCGSAGTYNLTEPAMARAAPRAQARATWRTRRRRRRRREPGMPHCRCAPARSRAGSPCGRAPDRLLARAHGVELP